MSKDKKQTPQQAFNQFLFDTVMDKLRAVELYEKEVAGYSVQISQHVKDHRENAAKVEPIINDLIKKVDEWELDRKALFPHYHTPTEDAIKHMQEQIKGLENRLSRAQDMIAECHPDGCIVVKKPSGRPKKGA